MASALFLSRGGVGCEPETPEETTIACGRFSIDKATGREMPASAASLTTDLAAVYVFATGAEAEEWAPAGEHTYTDLMTAEERMQTVLLVPNNLEDTVVEWWEKTSGEDDHIDFVTDDLTDFLAKIAD